MKPLMMLSVSATATATVLLAGSALAQQAQGQYAVGQQAQAQAAYPPPPQQAQAPVAPPPQAAAVPADTDHDAMVGRLGVGYLGRRSMMVGAGPVLDEANADGVMGNVQTTTAPVVGIRYWIDPVVGLDVGLGFSIASGSQEIDPPQQPPLPTQVDDAPITTFILHGGLPLSLAAAKHFSFQIVPELNVGYATQTIEDPRAAMGDVTNSGLHLDLGARAGAEIYFGFIGVPELSLQGSVGLRIDYDAMSAEQTSGSAVNRNRFWFGTTVYDNPWNIFTSNVAALYYF
jgi:hypothetical protein